MQHNPQENHIMLDKIFEQSQTAFKPMSDLAALNTKMLEEVAEKQKAFVSDMVSDSMAYAKELSAQKDFSGIYQTQKNYLESVQEKMIAASTDAYSFLTATQEKVSDVIKSNTPA